MSEKDLNGQLGSEELNAPETGPRVRPPAGQRMARGSFVPEDEEQLDSGTMEMVSSETFPIEDEAVEPYVPLEPMISTREMEPDFEVPELPVVEPLASGGGGGGNNGNGHYKPYSNPDTPNDRELGLFEHLAELRMRLLYSFVALGLGMVVTWNLGKPLQEWFAHPILKALENAGGGGKMVVNDPAGALTAYFYFSMVSGLILAMPVILFQFWRFIEPALTRTERRYSVVLIPFSIVLFILGAALGYYCSPLFFKFFLVWIPEGTVAYWDYVTSITLMAKMILVFGVSFQVPIIIIFLNKMGILTRNLLIDYWRHSVVVIFTVIAVLTPTWDPVTLCICATPPCLLYVLSIWLIKWL